MNGRSQLGYFTYLAAEHLENFTVGSVPVAHQVEFADITDILVINLLVETIKVYSLYPRCVFLSVVTSADGNCRISSIT